MVLEQGFVLSCGNFQDHAGNGRNWKIQNKCFSIHIFLDMQERVMLKIPIIVYSGILTSHPEHVPAVRNDKERESIFILRN